MSWQTGEKKHVVAFSILMDDVRRLVKDIKFNNSGRFFLYSSEGPGADLLTRIRGYVPSESNARYLFASSRSIDDPVIVTAFKYWKELSSTEEPFRFTDNGVVWWGSLIDFEEDRNPAGMGILVPEKVLLAERKSHSYLYILAALAALFVALLLYAVKTLRNLEEDQSSDLDLIHKSEDEIMSILERGENDKLEFKSTMRWNLKANKPGKEIELACLKTVAAFLNTEGGALFVGVEDNSRILGIEADQFPNEDKYLQHFSNIFNQHIGLEFSEFIEFAVRPLAQGNVFVVACRKSPHPVFVKNKSEEIFYIRVGSSTRQLTISQVLEYLKARK
jgi:hypothetical protein